MTASLLQTQRNPSDRFDAKQLSDNKLVYLKPNVLLEPLFNSWYAWPYLISPTTAALCTENLHLKIMQGFVAAPQIHVSALKNPKNMGGPFLNYPAERVGEIAALVEHIKQNLGLLLDLAKSIKQLDLHLIEQASGYSLEPLYKEIPELLRGTSSLFMI